MSETVNQVKTKFNNQSLEAERYTRLAAPSKRDTQNSRTVMNTSTLAPISKKPNPQNTDLISLVNQSQSQISNCSTMNWNMNKPINDLQVLIQEKMGKYYSRTNDWRNRKRDATLTQASKEVMRQNFRIVKMHKELEALSAARQVKDIKQ